MDKVNGTGLPIKEARKAAGLTQADLSKWLGIPLSTVADWGRGARNPSDWVVRLVVEKIEREGAQYKASK